MENFESEARRRFQRDYLNTWRIVPCRFCEGTGKVLNENTNNNIACPKCKGRKFE